MIALLKRVRPWPGCGDDHMSTELAAMRRRVTRLRREVQAMQTRADALYGQPEGDAWRDPEAGVQLVAGGGAR